MQDPCDLDEIIGSCSDSIEEESKRKSSSLMMSRNLEKLSEQSPLFIQDHGR